jgi:hypothetical protein
VRARCGKREGGIGGFTQEALAGRRDDLPEAVALEAFEQRGHGVVCAFSQAFFDNASATTPEAAGGGLRGLPSFWHSSSGSLPKFTATRRARPW